MSWLDELYSAPSPAEIGMSGVDEEEFLRIAEMSPSEQWRYVKKHHIELDY